MDIDDFEQCAGVAVHNLMEPLLAQNELSLTESQLDHLLARLGDYDEFHLVYALILCARFSPQRVARFLPQFLVHSDDSVFCTALNAIEALPHSLINDELLQAMAVEQKHPLWRDAADRVITKLRKDKDAVR